MTDDGVLLDRSAIEDASQRLGDRLERRGVVADLYIFGRRGDVNGVRQSPSYSRHRRCFHTYGDVIEEAHAEVEELSLPHWRLNEQASV